MNEQNRTTTIRAGTYCALLYIFSRAAFLLILLATTEFSAEERPFKSTTLTHGTVTLQSSTVIRDLKQVLTLGDSGWYFRIVQHGYAKRPFDSTKQETWAFFPLFPLLITLIAPIMGNLGAALLISNTCFLAAMVLLFRLVESMTQSPTAARSAAWFLAFSPLSFFFSTAFTESLFLFLTLASFLALLTKPPRSILAGALLGLASATRVTSAALLPAYALQLWKLEPSRSKTACFLCLSLSGLLLFMAFLWQTTGNALAFVDIQSAWDRGNLLLAYANRQAFFQPTLLSNWSFTAMHLFFAALAAVALLHFLRTKQWELALFLLCPLLLNLNSGSLLSLSRHVAALFPLYLFLADPRLSAAFRQAVLVIFVLFFALNAVLIGAHVTAGLT